MRVELKHIVVAVGMVFGAATISVATAQTVPAFVNPATGIPVFPGDLPERPYDVIGEVKAGVRKATVFSPAASEAKIYRELWERGQKLGADAVINAKYGNSHINALSWGSTTATGTAIRFRAVAPEAAAAPAK